MAIREQIEEKQKQIKDLQEEIYILRENQQKEIMKSYEMYVGKYYMLEDGLYVKVRSIQNSFYYVCIRAELDELHSTFYIENNATERLDFLIKNGVEVTREEFDEFIKECVKLTTKE